MRSATPGNRRCSVMCCIVTCCFATCYPIKPMTSKIITSTDVEFEHLEVEYIAFLDARGFNKANDTVTCNKLRPAM